MNTNGRAMNANDHAMNVNGRAMNVNGYAMNVNSRAHTGADPEDLRMRRRQMYWTTNLDPSSLGYDSESEGEVVEGPQLRTATDRSGVGHLETIRDLEGELREEAVASPRGASARIEGAGDVALRRRPAHTHSQFQAPKDMGAHSPIRWLILGISSPTESRTRRASRRRCGRWQKQGDATLQGCHTGLVDNPSTCDNGYGVARASQLGHHTRTRVTH
ncbi:hypothetical protein BC826DRAFT_976670 [Russula brevipes]|nr:hypothetical protein BC826DRAFT_976670 [Russula brevipes]